MSLHPEKTKFTIFHSNPNAIPWDDINLYFDENNLNTHGYNPNLKKRISYVNHESETPAIKFLGVFFDPALNFKYHTKKLTEKLARALYLLRQCKKILPEDALKTLYYSIFHCHLIYGILIYSCTNFTNLNSIIVKQKMAIRAITNSRYNAHTGPLFKRLNIVPLESLIKFFGIKFMYMYKANLVPRSFRNMWITRGELNNGNIILRNSSDFDIPRSRLSLVKRLPYCNLPDLWNKFSSLAQERIKQIQSVNLFSNRLKKYLVSEIEIICNRTTVLHVILVNNVHFSLILFFFCILIYTIRFSKILKKK